MSTFRVVIAVLCAALLAVTLVLLGVAFTLSRTVLNSDFVVAQLTTMPVHTVFAEEAKKQVPAEGSFLIPLIDDAAADLEPWAREQTTVLVEAFEKYVQGDEAFLAVISLEEPKRYLGGRMEEILGELEVPGLELLNAAQLQFLLAQVKADVNARIPDTFEVTESYFDARTLSGMRTAREYAGYVTWSLRLLPVLALVLLLLMAWALAWNGKSISRFSGVALLLAGIMSLVVSSVVQSVVPGMLPPGIPSFAFTALPAFIAECVKPLIVYASVVALVGAALVGLSFKLKSPQP